MANACSLRGFAAPNLLRAFQIQNSFSPNPVSDLSSPRASEVCSVFERQQKVRRVVSMTQHSRAPTVFGGSAEGSTHLKIFLCEHGEPLRPLR